MKELKEKAIWVLWKLMKKKDGKMTKVPISYLGNKTGASENYKDTWTNYETAISNVNKQNANGVSFIIPKGYFFLDIDHKSIESPFVKEMLERFNSYVEYSQSGNGIHIYGKVDLMKLPIDYIKDKKFYMKNSKLDIELYIGGLTNRFACFTGNAIKDIPLNNCTDAVLLTLNTEMKKSAPKYEVLESSTDEADRIINLLRSQKSHKKFDKLFDKGDFKDYGSQSEADLALCSIIAYRAGNNPDLIDKVFRKSNLYRDKWNRDDYRTETIKKAIESLNGNFHKETMPHPTFVKFAEGNKAYVSIVLLADFIRSTLTYLLVRDHAKQCLLLYLYENGVYKLYSDDMLIGVIKKFITDYDEELLQIRDVRGSIEHIKTDLNYIKNDELNSNENIINFKNGLLHLDDMTLHPHDKNEYSTIQIPCDWTNKDSDTPVFDKYIDTLSNGDNEVKNLLLEYMGAILSNVKGYKLKSFMILVGEANTGKSQYKALIEKLLGKDNYMSIDLSDLTERFATSSLYGKRLGGSADMGYLTVSDTKILKQLTGGDSIMAEFKGENHFEYVFNGLLLMCANKEPKFGANQNDNATYERIILIKCPNVIAKDKQDKSLLEKMYKEKEGIVYKAITAFKKVIDNDYRLSIPKSVLLTRKEYQKENDTITSFIEECLRTLKDDRDSQNYTTRDIYNAYLSYCKVNNNNFSRTNKELRDGIAKYYNIDTKDIIVHKTNGNYYKNITLNDNAKSDFYY